MEYRLLGSTGVRIGKIAYGTMSFGGDADEATARALFERAREAGVNLFDTADMYQKGISEEILGRLMVGCRDQIVLATKGYGAMGSGPNDRGASRFHMVRAVEASLKRLQTDRIDIYYIHHYDADTAVEDSLVTLDRLVTQGKILYPAISNFSAWQAQRALDICEMRGLVKPVVIQPMYNLVKRQAEVEILPMAQANRLAVVPYNPLGGGLLSGKYGVADRPASGRLVENKMYQARYGGQDTYQIAEDFRRLAREWGMHPVTLAAAWVTMHPGVTAALVGARSVEQLNASLAAADLTLTAEQYAAVNALTPIPPSPIDRSEDLQKK